MLQRVLLIFAAATTTTIGVQILRGSHEERRLQLWTENLWPKSTICYDPIGSEFTAKQKRQIMAGFTEFEEKTNLRFLDINKCTDQSLCGGCKGSVRFFQGGGCGSARTSDNAENLMYKSPLKGAKNTKNLCVYRPQNQKKRKKLMYEMPSKDSQKSAILETG